MTFYDIQPTRNNERVIYNIGTIALMTDCTTF